MKKQIDEEEDFIENSEKKLLIKKIWIVRIFGIIIACSLIFSVTFVSYTLTSAPDNIQTAIGYNGTFSNYFLLTTINNKPLYGFILACILFAYFLVLLSLWFSCFFALYMTKRKGPEIRSWCIIRICFFCCSLSCMKGMGMAPPSTRVTKDTQPGDYSEDYDGVKNYGSIQGASSISMNTDKNLKNSTEEDLPKEEYNPFDTDSFKRREKHSTFHGWGNQKRGIMGGDQGVYPRPDPFNIVEENNPSNLQTSKTDENIPRPKPKSRTTSMSTDPAKSNASLPNFSAAGGAPGKLQQPPGRQTSDPLASRSMEEFPREIMINPEYRSLLDTATRHIRLISHQKKKLEEEYYTEFTVATDIPPYNPPKIPPESSNSPPSRYSRDEFETSSDNDFDYDGAPASPTGSEKDMLKGKDKKK